MPTVNDVARRVGYQGPHIGIEIEVEGKNLPREVKGWRCEHDGSLRGESMEYVFPQPLLIDAAELQLKQLNLAFLKNKSEVEDTGYAGIHVHVNVGDMTPQQLIRFATAYYTVEELALRWCGEDRVGNLFCLGIGVAKLPLEMFKKALEHADMRIVHSDEIRYAALNFKALAEYGSFEFRSMRSTLDRPTILKWATMLLELRAFALEERPLDWLISEVSIQGKEILRTLLPTCYDMFYNMEGVNDSLRDNVRHTQMFIATLDVARMEERWAYRAGEAGRMKEAMEKMQKIPFPEMAVKAAAPKRARMDAGQVDDPWVDNIGHPLARFNPELQNEPEEDI